MGLRSAEMVLSDQAIRRLIESGRIRIDPYDPALMQPSSLDVRVDRLFRVFRNSRYPYIDVKAEQEELTELVVVDGAEPFILHPCLLYTSPSPRDGLLSRMPSSA